MGIKVRKIINGICVGLGFICVGLGVTGVIMPVLPTTPFFLAAAFLFAKSSERFHKWFMRTGLYKRYIEQAVKNKSMDKAAKRNMLITLSIVFALGIAFSPFFAKIIIIFVAALHFYYFLFRIKTVQDSDAQDIQCNEG